MSLLLNRLFASVALGHFSVDMMNGQRTVLFTYLAVMLSLSNTELGTYSTIYIMLGALVQPAFGYLADRIGGRWVVAGGMLWMSIFFLLAVFSAGQMTFIFLILGSLGSGSFHSAGSMQASLIGRYYLAGRDATAYSIFFLAGQMGYFIGPILGGFLLGWLGPQGLIPLGLLGLFVGGMAAYQFGKASLIGKDTDAPKREIIRQPSAPKLAILGLVIIAISQAWSQSNISTYMTKYLSDLGYPAAVYGGISGAFMLGSSIGGVLGGYMADRVGKRIVIILTMSLSFLPVYFLIPVGYGWQLYVLLVLSGALTGAAFSIIVVLAQRLVPVGVGLASGLTLGFMCTAGALGLQLSGWIADRLGVPFVIYMTAFIALCGGLGALLIEKEKKKTLPM